MGAKTAISAEDYLRTSFPDLDREYRDGELVERSLPDYPHGRSQGALFAFFWALRSKLALFPCVETRMRLRPGLILIPDVAVFYENEPPRVPETPPLIVIEVLSIDDAMSAVRAKLDEYKKWEVPHVWLVDPHAKRLYTCDAGLVEVASLRVPELEIELQPEQIFE
jgi:Uma2 family endonuclease